MLGSSIPAALGTAQDADAAWRALINAGNSALAHGDPAAALRSYDLALVEAERLMSRGRKETAALLLAPMALTISLSNLAELRRRADDREGAFRLKWRAVERLLEIAGDRAAHPALRLNCMRHLRYALAFLAEDTASDPSRQSDLDSLMIKARRVMDEALDHLRSLLENSGAPRPSLVDPTRH